MTTETDLALAILLIGFAVGAFVAWLLYTVLGWIAPEDDDPPSGKE